MNIRIVPPIFASLCLAASLPAAAQDADGPTGPPAGIDIEDSVFDETWISLGIGAAYSPSYSGSDDYVLSPLPVVQGRIAGVDIQPRPAGLALDFIPDPEEGVGFAFGPALRLRNDRANQIEDPVVALAGELDRAVEIGPSAGVQFPGLLNPFDSLSVGSDIRWDVAGAHGGMVIDPSITYFTPLSRGTIASLSLGTEYVDDRYVEYYYSVSPAQSAASGLPQFTANGGFTKVSATMLVGIDLDGNALNGGLGAVLIGGYSRLLGAAKNTPYTSIRGSSNQVFAGLGIGYTF